MTRKLYVATLLAGSSLFALPATSYGQQQSSDAEVVDTIVVTGSRIQSDGFEAPTPVTVAPVSELLNSAPTNVINALQELPQFLNSTNFNSGGKAGIGQGRGNFLNLRNLGEGRTLIMLDNIRMPPTTYQGRVNSEVIPQLLLERVEVVTAGASAAYGSDAVAGAVNYILDNDFSGIKAEASTGISKYGDAFNYRVGVAGGFDIGSRGHLIVSAERFETNGIQMKDRPPQGTVSYIAAGAVPGGGVQGLPQNPYIIWDNATWNILSEGGHISAGPLANTYFHLPGQFRTYNPGVPTGNSSVSQGGDGVALQTEQTITETADTNQAFARFEYGLNDNITAHVAGLYSQANVDVKSGYNFFDFAHTIYSGNPFLPAAIQTRMTTENIASFGLNKYITDSPLSPGRDDTRFYMIMAGVDGSFDAFGNDFNWDFNYTHGDTHQLAEEINTPEQRKLHAAVDAVRDPATNQIVCRVTLTNPGLYPGCVPFNMFGVKAASQAAVDYVHGTSRYDTYTTMDAVSANVQGNAFDLWAGPVSVAFGGEWRWQDLELISNSDPSIVRPVTGLRSIPETTPRFWLANVASAQAKLNVKEAFAEVAIPLADSLPFLQSLDVNGAVRLTDYSTSGTVTTWKAGGTWRPVDDVLFRLTRSRDIRAPSLFDLGASGSAGRSTVTDPLTGVGAVVLTAGGGNPNLNPEIANTLNFGVVFTPSAVPSFNIAVDFFDIKLAGEISTLSVQNIVNQCHFSNYQDPICAQIDRPLGNSNTTPANFPSLIRSGPTNSAFKKTRGFDLEASHNASIGDGSLITRALFTYIDRYQTQASPFLPVVEQAGTSGQPTPVPRVRATLSATYNIGQWSIFAQERMIGKVKLGFPPNNLYDESPIPAKFYTDLTVSYAMAPEDMDMTFYVTVKNLFDQRPPLVPGTSAPRFNFPTLAIYDIVGTTFTVGMRSKF